MPVGLSYMKLKSSGLLLLILFLCLTPKHNKRQNKQLKKVLCSCTNAKDRTSVRKEASSSFPNGMGWSSVWSNWFEERLPCEGYTGQVAISEILSLHGTEVWILLHWYRVAWLKSENGRWTKIISHISLIWLLEPEPLWLKKQEKIEIGDLLHQKITRSVHVPNLEND